MICYLTICNNGFTDFTKNNILNFSRVLDNGNNILKITALDSQAFSNIENFLTENKTNINIKNIILDKDFIDISNYETFNSPGFIKIMNKKIDVIIKNLETYDLLHYFDGDVFFFQDPSETVKSKLENFDLVFQQDSPRTKRNDGWDLPLHSNYVCAGNFSVKKNDKSFYLLNEVKNRLNESQNDQEVLFTYLNSLCENIKDYPHADLEVYDPEEFQNGYDTFFAGWNMKEKKMVVHANFMVGKETKINALKSIGGWLI
jgi:hypothetical protein